uniref:MIP17285p n=1 Tax=Drosophila melanogaster TaxID=7227 RepID=D3DMU7_DROME|nr:MIP17285p [Drosophila melanogaster]
MINYGFNMETAFNLRFLGKIRNGHGLGAHIADGLDRSLPLLECVDGVASQCTTRLGVIMTSQWRRGAQRHGRCGRTHGGTGRRTGRRG